jgi:hypothetical protein
VWVHTAAYIQNEEIGLSRLHVRARSRQSFYILVTYQGRQRVAEVSYFVRVELPGRSPLRLAVCNLYKAVAPVDHPDLGVMLRARVHFEDNRRTFQLQNWAITLAAIETKLMGAERALEGGQHADWFFQTTSMASGLH